MEVMRQRRPHVIVSDISMPGRDGYDLVRTIRGLPEDRGGNIPAIALTALASAGERYRALTAGFDAHLSKPVEIGDLISAVDSLARAS